MTKEGIHWAKIRIYQYSMARKKYDMIHTKQATLTSASLQKLNQAIRKWNKGDYRVKILQRGFQPGVQWKYP